MVDIVYGRAGSGKTYTLMNEIETVAAGGTPAIVIVPEQLSMTREFYINSRGLKNVSVLSFSRFANTVFRSLGGTAKKHPDKAMQAAAVYLAVQKVYDDLRYFKSTAFTHGFITALISTFSEFDTNCMSEKAVFAIPDGELSERTKNKYRDMFLIYSEYKKMWTDEYKDPAGDIVEAAALLELNDIYKDTVFAFDGFYGFTPQQLTLIEQIVRQSPRCVFAFTTDMDSDIFKTVTDEVHRLERLCKKQGADINRVFVGDKNYKHTAPAIVYAEKNAFDLCVKKSDAELCGISIYRAKNINDELGYIACKIKNDVLNNKYRYRDIAVICPAAADIRFLMASVFEKHGIPAFTDTGRTLRSQPLCAFVSAAFDIVKYGFEAQYVLRLLKTGLAGVAFDDISLLENYLRVWKLRSKHWDGEPWTKNPDGIGGFEKEIDAERLDKINSIRFFVQKPLERFKSAVSGTRSADEILRAVYTLTEDFGVRKNLELTADGFLQAGELSLYNEYTRVYGVFIDMLDSIYESCGSRKMNCDRFYDMFCVCAASCSVVSRPSRTDEVVFASLGQARAEDKRCVYIPRLNSAYIPGGTAGSSLITEADKRIFSQYGIAVSMDARTTAAREYFDFYCALTSPTDEVCLSYSIFSVTGDALNPSQYLEAVQKSVGIQPITEKDLPPEFLLVSIAGAGDYGARTGDSAATEAVLDIKGYAPHINKSGKNTLSQSVVEGLYGKHLHLSFSGMEEFVSCPFKFFVNRGLRAKKSDPVEFKPANIGTFIHKGLEDLLSGDYDISSPESVSAAVDKIADNYMQTELCDCIGRSKRFDYMFERAKFALASASQNVAEEIRNSDFKPYASEVDISQSCKPYQLKDGYTLTLTGSIDRVDKTDDGLAKIVDYKSGTQAFSFKKMYNGLSLQLPVYASAVRGQSPDTDIAAMYYLKVGMPKVEKVGFKGMDDEQYQKALEKYYTRDGVFSARDNIPYRLDNTGKLFSKIKDERRLSDTQMNALIDFAADRITKTGQAIAEGRADIDPICDKDANACEYCDFGHICGFSNSEKEGKRLDALPEDFLKDE